MQASAHCSTSLPTKNFIVDSRRSSEQFFRQQNLHGGCSCYLSFSAAPHPVGCSTGGASSWRIGGSTDNVKNLIAVAMAAKLSDRPVLVYFNDTYSGTTSCDQGGTSGYPVISGMSMQ